MARLLSTNDPYTSWGAYPLIDSIYSGSVFDVDSTSYNITLLNRPLCFFHGGLSEIGIKDNSGLFTIDLTTSVSNFVCSSIPLVGQTTELIVKNTDIPNIKIAPESVVNSLFSVTLPDCDGDPTFCVHTDDVENFCSVSGYSSTGEANTGSIEYLQYQKQIRNQSYYESLQIDQTEKDAMMNGLKELFVGLVGVLLIFFIVLWIRKLLSSFFNR